MNLNDLDVRSPSLKSRFWAKVDVKDPASCWIWLGGTTNYGYGTIYVGRRDGVKKKFGAHRVVWELMDRELPSGLHVLHTCDNTACVNPGHLYLGTHQDNMRDMSQRGRQPGPNMRGEECSWAKLTAKDVRRIKRYLKEGKPIKRIAEYFGVSRMNIYHIRDGRNWSHITLREDTDLRDVEPLIT